MTQNYKNSGFALFGSTGCDVCYLWRESAHDPGPGAWAHSSLATVRRPIVEGRQPSRRFVDGNLSSGEPGDFQLPSGEEKHESLVSPSTR